MHSWSILHFQNSGKVLFMIISVKTFMCSAPPRAEGSTWLRERGGARETLTATGPTVGGLTVVVSGRAGRGRGEEGDV